MPGNAFRPSGRNSVAVIAADGSSHESVCFSDEVIVDFPSIVPAIDRMRQAFLTGDRPASLPTVLALTHQEACTGVTVPVDIVVRCTCPHCGGRGESWTEPCGRCAGHGIEDLPHQVRISVPPGVANDTRFTFTVTPRHHPGTRFELRVLVG